MKNFDFFFGFREIQAKMRKFSHSKKTPGLKKQSKAKNQKTQFFGKPINTKKKKKTHLHPSPGAVRQSVKSHHCFQLGGSGSALECLDEESPTPPPHMNLLKHGVGKIIPDIPGKQFPGSVLGRESCFRA